jgi:nitrite reductase (NADH) small subunit
MSQVLKICEQTDLVANSGVCAIVEGQQIALFYLPKEIPTVYAIGTWDPIGKANVLSRGMVGDINQRLVVASPLYKQHFDLQTGNCIEDSTMSVPVYHVELVADEVLVTL